LALATSRSLVPKLETWITVIYRPDRARVSADV
jgi:hypothetical protein